MSLSETWKDIPIKGFENYQASTFGRIKRKEYISEYTYKSKLGVSFIKRSKLKEKILTQSIHQKGKNKNGNADYYFTSLGLTHRIIAITFLPNISNRPTVNHLDGDGLNNRVDNLEWSTHSHNQKHAYKLGLRKPNTKINSKGQYVAN